MSFRGIILLLSEVSFAKRANRRDLWNPSQIEYTSIAPDPGNPGPGHYTEPEHVHTGVIPSYKKHEDFMFKSKIERPKPLSKTPGSGAYEYVVLIAASFGHFDEARLDLL